VHPVLESRPGTYVLWLRLDGVKHLRIGKLGDATFEPGFYAYVGSAFGPGGVRARLGRHARADKTHRWHIDYLRSAGRVVEAWVSYDLERHEHRWAGVLSNLAGARLPVPGFGASDCGCPSHLIRFSRQPSLRKFLDCEPAVATEIRRIRQICE